MHRAAGRLAPLLPRARVFPGASWRDLRSPDRSIRLALSAALHSLPSDVSEALAARGSKMIETDLSSTEFRNRVRPADDIVRHGLRKFEVRAARQPQ